MSILSTLLIVPIQGYRRLVSPMLPPACRFDPSCSAFAVGSIRTHGAARGVWLALRRVARCHPGHAGGWDPVPPRARREKGKLDGSQDAARLSAPDPGPGSLPGVRTEGTVPARGPGAARGDDPGSGRARHAAA